MADIDVEEVERVAHAIVQQAKEDGTLDSQEWTPLKVRREVERRLSLEEGSLDEKPYRSAVRAAIDAAMGEEEEEEAEGVDSEPAKQGKRGKAARSEKPRAKAGEKSKAKKKGSETKVATKRTKKSTIPKRSESVVPSTDDEPQQEAQATSSVKSSNPATKRKAKKAVVSDEEQEDAESPEPPKKRQKTAHAAEEVQTNDIPKADPGPSKSPEAQGHATSSEPPPVAEDSGYKSESEMSVLIDDEPPKRAKKKGKETDGKKKSSKEPKPRKPKQPSKELSKDDETIKRLKSFVVACGVRKQWAREFKGMEGPSEQIRRLKQILADLGMTGRMSLEQAKAIRAKRELAQELEDVQNFEKSVVSAGSRARAKNSKSIGGEAAEEVEEEEEEIVGKPRRSKGNARQSIMAFLEDQSDDE